MIPEQARTGESEIRENGLTAYFSIDGDSYNFPIKYYGDKWRQFPDHMKEQLADMVSSLWVATIPAERKIFTSRLDNPDVEVIKYISYQSQNYYRNKVDAPSIEGNPELRITKGDNDWSDIELESGNCGVYFSGGRDIMSTLVFLEDAGYEPHLQMHNNDASWDTGEQARVEFTEEQEKHIDTLWNNRKVVKSGIEKEQNLSLYHVAPRSWMIFFSSLPFLKYDLQIYGNEATTTRYDKIAKNKILHSSWQQSMPSNWMMTRWADRHDINVRVGSILSEMGDYRLTKELVERRPDLWEVSNSCFFLNEETYEPCSKCHKCSRNAMILEAIGTKHPYDLDRLKDYKMDPAHIQWATIMPDDLAHINARNDGWYKRAPQVENERMEGLTFQPQRANPALFLTRDEFLNIYSSVMDDDACWLPTEHTPYHETEGPWVKTTDLEFVWDVISEWELTFEYRAKVTENNSLLQ